VNEVPEIPDKWRRLDDEEKVYGGDKRWEPAIGAFLPITVGGPLCGHLAAEVSKFVIRKEGQ
jgi:hypothetical protein